uniref:DUF6150 family protein n=1 Tax=Flavobacterium sp. TaxID=239 RepID=UPI00404A5E02
MFTPAWFSYFTLYTFKSACLFVLFFASKVSAQKVFSAQYANQADVKVYVVQYENQADLKVYKVKYEN